MLGLNGLAGGEHSLQERLREAFVWMDVTTTLGTSLIITVTQLSRGAGGRDSACWIRCRHRNDIMKTSSDDPH